MNINSTCVCGGTVEQPNDDCERCQMVQTIGRLTSERDESRLACHLYGQSCEAERAKESARLHDALSRLARQRQRLTKERDYWHERHSRECRPKRLAMRDD